MGRPNLEIFAETLLDLARHDNSVFAVTSDSRGSGKLTAYGETLPEQIIEVGIAEQGLVGVAAGMASTGKKVFAVSPASFLTARALEQIKNDVAYSSNPVVLVGISAGVSYGALGSTHHSLHDFAALRAINNIDIIAPADNFEARQAVLAAAASETPVYLRFGKRALPDLHPPDTHFEIGKAIRLRTGNDVSLIATGETVAVAMAAAERLESEGLSASVLSMHTLRPLDRATLIEVAGETRAVITLEEHSVHGGLGEACAAVLLEAGVVKPFKIMGIPDEYTMTGSQQEIFDHYGLNADGVAVIARNLLDHAGAPAQQ